MIHLFHGALVDRHFAGALGPDESRRMFAYVWSCAKCRRRYERQLLFERARPQGEELQGDRLWRSIAASAGLPRPAQARRGRHPGLAVLVSALAGGLAILVPFLAHTPSRTEPVARGALTVPAATPNLHLYRTRGGKSAPMGGELRADDGVLIAYSNPSEDLRYIMVFGVDAQGGVRWYYPSYQRVGDNPAAVPIRTGALGVELGEEVRHDLPSGDLRVFGLFLRQPRQVMEIEALVGRELAAHGGMVRALSWLDVSEGEQTSILLEVRP